MVDDDRIKGAGNKAMGAVKDAAGKLTGDEKLQAEGKMQHAKGEVQSTVGGAKDTLRDATDEK